MPFVAVRRRTSIAGIYAAELLVLLFGALAFSLYSLLDLPLRSPWGLWRERMLNSVPCYGLSLVLALFIIRLYHLRLSRKRKELIPHAATWRTFKEHYLGWKRILHDFRYINIICLMFVVFVNLKHLIPYVNDHMFDEVLMSSESRFFRGSLLSEIVLESIGTDAAPLLSTGYTLFYPYVALVIYLLIFLKQDQLTQEFLFAFCLTWFMGILTVYIFPTVGPCFHMPELFDSLPATGVTDMQLKLLKHKLVLDAHPNHPAATYLISGFPSLHVAVVVLGTMYLWRVHRGIGAVSGLFAGITVVTTLYFGWHYVADDIGGLILAVVCYRAAKKRFSARYLYVKEAPPPRAAPAGS